MNSKKVGIIIISVLLVISCTCSIIGTVRQFKNNDNNLIDNKEINNINEESKDKSEEIEDEEETEKKSPSYVEPTNVITDALPVFNDYKIIKVNDDFDKVIKDNGLEVDGETVYGDYDVDIAYTILIDKNYKEIDGVYYSNDMAFYDEKNKKIYSGYAFIDVISNNIVYLGNYDPGDYTKEDYSYDDGSVRIDVLQIDEDKIITVDLKAPVYGDNLDSHESYTYFKTAGNYIIYSGRLYDKELSGVNYIFDEKLNIIQNKINNYYINENDELIIKKKDTITIYENNLKLLKEKTIKNISNLSEKYVLLNEKSTLKLLSYEDIINEKNNIINTGIKLSKKQEVYNIYEEDKISIIIEDKSKSEKDIKKICKKDYNNGMITSYGIEYTYDINNKKLSQKNYCIVEL